MQPEMRDVHDHDSYRQVQVRSVGILGSWWLQSCVKLRYCSASFGVGYICYTKAIWLDESVSFACMHACLYAAHDADGTPARPCKVDNLCTNTQAHCMMGKLLT